MLITIPLIAQVVKDESELAAKPFYISATGMRSVSGKMETTYGQELFTSSALTGVCRGGISYADLSRNSWAAFGTHLRVQVADQDGTLSDITPVIERGELSSAFSTSSGSATITVTDDAHGLVADQLITFPGTSSAANVTITGNYTVSSVHSASSYSFVTTTTANTSTAGVGPSIIDYEYRLKPGNQSNLGGLGYGVGGYGSGGYGSPASSQDLDARTFSFAPWGQNLIVNPNWGGVYEWAPNTTASELVSAGDFASTSTWTQGSGWAIAAGKASASAGAGLSQTISLSRSAWHLLDLDVIRNSGTVIATIGGSTVGSAIVSTGTYKRAFFSPVTSSQSLVLQGGGTFSGSVDNVSVKVIATAELIPTAPSSVGSIFVTAERNLVACGAVSASTSVLDPMLVRWSASENNQDWTASAANNAGSYILSHGSRIVRGIAANRENVIHTDTALYRMRSVTDPSVVYAFDLISEGCGLIGPNATVFTSYGVFWITKAGTLYRYAGGAAVHIPNPSERDLWDNFADVQGAKVYIGHLSGESEILIFYPDERDGVECSRLHRYNYVDNTWVVDDANAQTTWIDAGIFPFPISTNPSGNIFYQEKDFSNDGSARTTSLESSYFTVGAGKGDNFATVTEFRPDFASLRGGGQITFYSRNDAQGSGQRTYGPYNFTSATKRISVRIKGRQIKFKLTTNDAPTFYRVGDMTFDVKESGQRK